MICDLILQKLNVPYSGNCNLDPYPEWMLKDVKLKGSESVNYLDVSLSHAKPNVYLDNIINACRRAYYVMQGAGFNNNNGTMSYVWKAEIRPVLTYCCNYLKPAQVCTDTTKVHLF